MQIPEKNIAFLGLGNMGLPMATQLAAAGHNVYGYDPAVKSLTHDIAVNLHISHSLQDSLNKPDVAVLMLPNGKVVLDCLNDILSGKQPPKYIVDCSTIAIDDARQAHEITRKAGVAFLDAPVSGGTKGAASGTLTAMVGGDEAALNDVKPLLAPMFKTIVYCGAAGAGQTAKLCNNQLLATTMIGTAEAFILGRKLGLDPATLFQVLSTSTGSSWSVNQYCPLSGVGPESPADHHYEPGFSAQMMLKDLRLSRLGADSIGETNHMATEALKLYEQFVNSGEGAKDFSAIITHLEKTVDH